MELIHDYLAAAARNSPDAVAVVDRGLHITYEELADSSDKLASRLIELGVSVGDRVGLYLPKSIDAVIGIYGIMKAGAAYVPIDSSFKNERAAYIAEDCGLKVLISTGSKQVAWPAFVEAGVQSFVDMDDSSDCALAGASVFSRDWMDSSVPTPGPRLISSDLAYILYTSGSTGDPKGVMLTHQNCLAFVNWAVAEYEIESIDRLSSHAPFHFDLSTLDLYGAAVAGATLYLVPKSVSLLAVEVKKFIESNKISVWYSVPSILTMLVEMGGLEKGDLPSLRVLLFAGEVFPTKYLSRLMTLLPHAQFANLYGPTETNVCTAYTVQAVPPEDSDPVSIGKAITNVETFVLDSSDGLVAPGTVGELVVRGPTVMSGYWGDAHLTAAKLIPSPLPRHLGDMVYRTGDLVVEQDNGTYKFIGRRDNQIKSRGYRIELGDVESALSSHPQVLEAVAIAVPDEKISNRIIAFASTIENVGESDLKRYCNDRLPRYMVPERIDVREQLPKTSTGKIDRKALGASAEPAPDGR